MDKIIEESMMPINDCWTTAGVIHGIQLLIRRMSAEFDHAHQQSASIKQLLNAAYQRFHDGQCLELVDPPLLNLTRYRRRLDELEVSTWEFRADSKIIMLEKRSVVKKFYIGLVTQARIIFQQVRMESEAWLRLTLDPIIARIQEHKAQLVHRLENISKVHANLSSIQERIEVVRREMMQRKAELDQIEAIVKEFALLTGVTMRSLDSQPAAATV